MDKDKPNELVADLRVADRLHNPNAETIIRVSADTIRDVAAKYLMPYATEIIRIPPTNSGIPSSRLGFRNADIHL